MHRKQEIQEDVKPELSYYDNEWFQFIHKKKKKPFFHNAVADAQR